MFSRKVWEVGPCPWATVRKQMIRLNDEREKEAETRAAIAKANEEARKLAKARRTKERAK